MGACLAALGGSIEIDSRPGGGTMVAGHIPVAAQVSPHSAGNAGPPP